MSRAVPERSPADQDMWNCRFRDKRHRWEPRHHDEVELYPDGRRVQYYRQWWICGKGCKTGAAERLMVDTYGDIHRVSFVYHWTEEYKRLDEGDPQAALNEKYHAAAPELFGLNGKKATKKALAAAAATA